MNKKTFFGGKIRRAISTLAIIAVIGGGLAIPTIARADVMDDLQSQIASLLQQISLLQSQLNTLEGVSSDSTVCPYTWSNNLSLGNTGVDVLNLQKALNADTTTEVASSGIGSDGNETEYFGSLTKAAVVKFQNKYASEVLNPIGLNAGTGYFGTMTRNKLNELHGTCVVPEPVEPIIEEPVIVNKVTLTDDNPVLNQVPRNAKNVALMNVAFEGNDVVDSLVVEKIGWLNEDQYENIYLYKDGIRLNTIKQFNSNDIAIFPNLNLIAPFTLSVVSDFDGEYTGIQTGVKLVGTYDGLPLESNMFHLVNMDVGTIAITSTSSVDSIIVSQRNAQIAEFKLKASSTEAITVNQIELYNEGHNVLSNIRITDGDNDFSGIVSGSRLIFNVDTFIKEDRSKTFEVYADIDGRNNDSVKLTIRNSYDIRATGDNFGFGVSLVQPDWTTDFTDTVISDLNLNDKGNLTIEDVDGLESQALTWGDNHVKVLGFTLEAEDEGFEITELTFALNDNADAISKIEVYQGNNKVGQETVDGETTIVVDSSFVVNGERDFSVYVDLNDLDETASTTFSVDLTKMKAIGINSDEDITKNKNISGETQYVYTTLISVENSYTGVFAPSSERKLFGLTFTSSNAKFATNTPIITLHYEMFGVVASSTPVDFIVKLGSDIIATTTKNTNSGQIVIYNNSDDDIILGSKELVLYAKTLDFDTDGLRGISISVKDTSGILSWTGKDKDGKYLETPFTSITNTIDGLPVDVVDILAY